VPGAYVDTSALGRVLLGEPDADAVLSSLRNFDVQVSSRLLRIELRRLATRHGVLDNADRLLTAVSLVPIDEELLQAAETVPPPSVATLDAIHLTTALRLAAADVIEVLMTYDSQLLEGARHHGIKAISPTTGKA
jgi:predicted nucleic acid-binding protein